MGTNPEARERVLMQEKIGTQIEVMLHSDRSEFSQRPRWYLHAIQGGTKFACILRSYVLYNQGQNWELCQKGHSESSFRNISSLYSKVSIFARIPDPASVFAFKHPDRKVLTEPSRYTERYPCLYLKVSEFHLAAVVEVCYCI
jgi:hypothetical protein